MNRLKNIANEVKFILVLVFSVVSWKKLCRYNL